MSDLSAFPPDTFDVITCCYGYGLADDVSYALSEAHRVLAPGGILVIATWERSAMLSIGREVLETVRGGGRDPLAAEDDEAFLPPRMSPPDVLELSGPGEFEALLVGAGFDQPGAVRRGA
jgi:SAM-dependent methyltransferase